MKISIVYHVYKNATNLEKSLFSVINQTNKNFELIIVDDNGTEEIKAIISKYDFSAINKMKYINFNQNLGHSFSFNVGLKEASCDYVFYMGSNINLENNFIEVLNKTIEDYNNPDVISFSNEKIGDNVFESFEKFNKDFFQIVNQNFKNKIFSTSFLRENDIHLADYKYLPLVFLVKVFEKFKKWVSIDKNIASFVYSMSFTYNLYDFLEQAEYLLENETESSFWKTNKDQMEYIIIRSLIFVFLMRIFKTVDSYVGQNSAIDASLKLLDSHLPNWRKNSYLWSSSNTDKKQVIEYIKNFKANTRYVKKMLKEVNNGFKSTK